MTRGAGESAGSCLITPLTGSFTVAPADQLVVQVGNGTQIYGASLAGFGVNSAKYYASAGGALRTLSISSVGNLFTVDDSLGTTASFTLAALSPQTRTGGNLRVGNYGISGTGLQISDGNFNSNTFANGNLAVTPKTLTASAAAVSKVYDGGTSMAGLALGLAGGMTGDLVTLAGTGTFAQRNVGTSLAFSVSNLAVSGADAANYLLAGNRNLSGNNGVITAKSLSLSGTTANNKVYDGTTARRLRRWARSAA